MVSPIGRLCPSCRAWGREGRGYTRHHSVGRRSGADCEWPTRDRQTYSEAVSAELTLSASPSADAPVPSLRLPFRLQGDGEGELRGRRCECVCDHCPHTKCLALALWRQQARPTRPRIKHEEVARSTWGATHGLRENFDVVRTAQSQRTTHSSLRSVELTLRASLSADAPALPIWFMLRL